MLGWAAFICALLCCVHIGHFEDVSLMSKQPEFSHWLTLGNLGSCRMLQGSKPVVRIPWWGVTMAGGKGSPWEAEVAEGMAQASSQMESVARLKICKANRTRQGLANRVGVEMGLIFNRYKWQIPEGCPLSRNDKDSLQRNRKESRGWQKDFLVAMKSHTSIPVPPNHLEKTARIKHLKEEILTG